MVRESLFLYFCVNANCVADDRPPFFQKEGFFVHLEKEW